MIPTVNVYSTHTHHFCRSYESNALKITEVSANLKPDFHFYLSRLKGVSNWGLDKPQEQNKSNILRGPIYSVAILGLLFLF
jgi:hypothetical protein